MSRLLLAGESWNTYATHAKGNAAYATGGYAEGGTELIAALEHGGHRVDYLRNHEVVEGFPYEVEQLAEYDAIILSDVPADSFLLPEAVFVRGERRPNRLASIAQFVRDGGGLLMIGGFMSFSGFEGRGRYGLTPLAEVLPVDLLTFDDRVESPEGVVPAAVAEHAITRGLPSEWPYFLGYNRLISKAASHTLMNVGGDPFLVTGTHGAGRTAAFASDCSPHWGSPEFMQWPHYGQFWTQLADWVARDATRSTPMLDK